MVARVYDLQYKLIPTINTCLKCALFNVLILMVETVEFSVSMVSLQLLHQPPFDAALTSASLRCGSYICLPPLWLLHLLSSEAALTYASLRCGLNVCFPLAWPSHQPPSGPYVCLPLALASAFLRPLRLPPSGPYVCLPPQASSASSAFCSSGRSSSCFTSRRRRCSSGRASSSGSSS